jgi:hypothetical protein
MGRNTYLNNGMKQNDGRGRYERPVKGSATRARPA